MSNSFRVFSRAYSAKRTTHFSMYGVATSDVYGLYVVTDPGALIFLRSRSRLQISLREVWDCYWPR